MKTTKKIFGVNIFKHYDRGINNHTLQTNDVLSLILGQYNMGNGFEKTVTDNIGKKWTFENNTSMAFEIESYTKDNYHIKRDVFDYAFNQKKDGLLLSDDKGKAFGALRINHAEFQIIIEISNIHMRSLNLDYAPGDLLDAVLEREGSLFLYATPFVYADGHKDD